MSEELPPGYRLIDRQVDKKSPTDIYWCWAKRKWLPVYSHWDRYYKGVVYAALVAPPLSEADQLRAALAESQAKLAEAYQALRGPAITPACPVCPQSSPDQVIFTPVYGGNTHWYCKSCEKHFAAKLEYGPTLLDELKTKLTAAQADAAAMREALLAVARWHHDGWINVASGLVESTIKPALAANAGAELLAELERLRKETHQQAYSLEDAQDSLSACKGDLAEAIAQREQALAVAGEAWAVLTAAKKRSEVAFSPSQIIEALASAIALLANLAALTSTEGQKPSGATS